MRGKISSHLAEDEVELVHDDAGDDSEEEMNQNYGIINDQKFLSTNLLDNFDPDAEDNPANDYPDEEEEGLTNSGQGEESDYGDYEDYDDYEDEYVESEKKSKDFFKYLKHFLMN